jgi:hypothetical protein
MLASAIALSGLKIGGDAFSDLRCFVCLFLLLGLLGFLKIAIALQGLTGQVIAVVQFFTSLARCAGENAYGTTRSPEDNPRDLSPPDTDSGNIHNLDIGNAYRYNWGHAGHYVLHGPAPPCASCVAVVESVLPSSPPTKAAYPIHKPMLDRASKP